MDWREVEGRKGFKSGFCELSLRQDSDECVVGEDKVNVFSFKLFFKQNIFICQKKK